MMFQAKIRKIKENLSIIIPKDIKRFFIKGDTVIVSQKIYPLFKKDLEILVKKLKGKYVRLSYHPIPMVTEGFLKGMDDNFLILCDRKNDIKDLHNFEDIYITSLREENVFSNGYRIDGRKVSKSFYEKKIRKGEFRIASK